MNLNYRSLFLIILFSVSLLIILSGLGCKLKENFENSRSALPKGIPRKEIPNGDEDLYIKKSEIVPPVCPKCPDVNIDKFSHQKQCPLCPPCGRCPEPNFDCKKVPNYARTEGEQFPRPVLTDFSQFGM